MRYPTKLLLITSFAGLVAPLAYSQTLVEGKNAVGATATANPVQTGGVGSTGQTVRQKFNDDGTPIIKSTGPPNYANGQVTASTTAGTFVAARATRRSCLLINTDASITVYFGAATVSSSNGVPLGPGQSISITTTALVQVVSASGSPVVAYFDEYD